MASATMARRPRFRCCGWPLELYRLDGIEGYEGALLAVVHDDARPWGYVLRAPEGGALGIERFVSGIGPGELDGLRLADPSVTSQAGIIPGGASMEALALLTVEIMSTVGEMPEPWSPRRRR